MKKVLILIIALVSFWSINVGAVKLPVKTDHEKVNLYLFYSDSCPHCHKFIEYFLKVYNDEYKDYFEIVTYLSGTGNEKNLTGYIEANHLLAKSVSGYFNVPSDKFGFPFIVVGDYYTLGFAESKGETIINEALKQYQNETYQDIVRDLKKNESEDVKEGTLQDAAKVSGISVPRNPDYDIIYIVVFLLIIVGGVGGLFYLSRKKG